MHAIAILQRCLTPLLANMHARRLATLFEAVVSCVSGPALSLTDVGRRFSGGALLRNKIKRADRLLGNRRLQGDARSIYAALCRITLARIAAPVILIDWSDLKADQSLHLLRASLPVGGRALTLYEEVHPQKKLGNRAVQHRFLQRLSEMLPAGAEPIIVADSGFKVPFYREVERLGWRWVGRVRGRDFVRLKRRWASCKTIFRRATPTPTALGEGDWVRSNPLRAIFVLVRQANKGRRGNNANGKRSRSKKSQQAARAAREPWLLVASTRFADWPAKRVVRLYRQRMQIEIGQPCCLHKSVWGWDCAEVCCTTTGASTPSDYWTEMGRAVNPGVGKVGNQKGKNELIDRVRAHRKWSSPLCNRVRLAAHRRCCARRPIARSTPPVGPGGDGCALSDCIVFDPGGPGWVVHPRPLAAQRQRPPQPRLTAGGAGSIGAG